MRVFAPAKVNLALHVTGRRSDGYHLLDSAVVFAGVGDWLEIAEAGEMALSVTGPLAAGVPADRSNLVWRAAEAFGRSRGASILVEKYLPNAGGIGGGSADAGAAIRGLSRLWQKPAPDLPRLLEIGADLPVCVPSTPARMRGIGDRLDPLPALPPLWLVLVNPGVPVHTGEVFRALVAVDGTPMPDPDWTDTASLAAWLSRTRNDLESAAIGIAPAVGEALGALSVTEGCLMARMSGSGGTCFGLYARDMSAETAAETLRARYPGWWVEAAPVLTGPPEIS